jgi:putative phage-type endonuclease
MTPEYCWKIEQGTPEWDQVRLGRLTGSDFHLFLSSRTDTKEEKLAEKATERYMRDSDNEHFTTWAMERGHILEPEARRLYQGIVGNNVKTVGFVKLGDYVGCSPDGLVGEDGLIEIKCPLAKNFLIWKNKEYIKPEYRTQIQFNLYVTQRKWCDFFVYHPRLGCYTVHVLPDPEIQQKIATTIDECVEKIKEYETLCC